MHTRYSGVSFLFSALWQYRKQTAARQVCFCLIALFGIAPQLSVAKTSATGALRVSLIDRKSHRPIAFAIVSLYGSQNARGVSGVDGTVIFKHLDPGKYDLELRSARYIPRIVRAINLVAQRTTSLKLSLEPLAVSAAQLPPPIARERIVAIVKVSPKPSPFDPNTATGESEEAQLSGSLLNALGTLPGVLLQGARGSASASLNGHSPSQTSVNIGGIPVLGFGSAANLSFFDNDLFDSVGINAEGDSGSPGGTINFEARNPTLDWMAAVEQRVGGLNSTATTLVAAGTSGRVGFSLTHATSTTGDPLDGQRFLDTSGLDYIHEGAATASGTAFKARFPLSTANVLSASVVQMDLQNGRVCHIYTGVLPCGYGPGASAANSLLTTQISDQITLGQTSAKVTAYRNLVQTSSVSPSLSGTMAAQATSTRDIGTGFMLSGVSDITLFFPLTFSLSSVKQAESEGGGAYDTSPIFSFPSTTFTQASLSAPFFASRRSSGTMRVGMQQNGASSGVNGEIDLAYRLTDRDTILFSQANGLRSYPTVSSSGFSDPSSIAFNCGANDALGIGPFAASTAAHSAQSQLQFTHNGYHVSTSAVLTHQVLLDSPVYGIVNATAFDPAAFAPAYLQALAQSAQQACGITTPFTFDDLYFTISGIAPRATYDTAQISVRINVSPNVAARLSYSFTSAHAYGAGGPLFSAESTVISGRQLPQVPRSSANFALAGILGPSGIQALSNVQYVGGNNASNVPPYVTIDAGFSLPLHRGNLVLSVQNLTNRNSGPFATDTGAVSLATEHGSYATIAQPLQRRTFAVQYRLPIGKPAIANRSPAFGSGPRRLPYQVAGPPDPLMIDGESDSCGPEMLPAVRGFEAALRAYLARIQAARTENGYPAIFPSSDYERLRFIYRKNGARYTVLVSRDPTASVLVLHALRDQLTSCLFIHYGNVAEAQHVGLYVSPHSESSRVLIFFAFDPGIGFYTMPLLIEDNSIPLLPLPKSPPIDPFALNRSTACTEAVRPAAEAVMSQLKNFTNAIYNRSTTPQPPDEFHVLSHDSPGGRWLEFTDDDGLINEIAPCVNVHGASVIELQNAGLGGTSEDTLDYNPHLGFYRLAP